MVDTRRLEQLVRSRGDAGRPARRGGRQLSGSVTRIPSPGARSARHADALNASWATLRVAQPVPASRSRSALSRTIESAAEVADSVDMLRAQLLQALRTRGWRSIGVTAPVRGCGASFISAALAQSFARLTNVRTVLLDLDLEQGGLGDAFGLMPDGRITDMIAGDVLPEEHLCRLGGNLALGLTLPCRDGRATLFENGAFSETMDEIWHEYRPDVILCDLPPLLTGDSTIAALPNLDGVLVVADGTRTQARDLHECERLLQERTQLLGVVLNKGRARRPASAMPR